MVEKQQQIVVEKQADSNAEANEVTERSDAWQAFYDEVRIALEQLRE
ncbi:hypothetical protein ACFSTH_14295 [Paenibacillus yanchengensis]|uniref:Uncharacterized protein n=1 Tax=Paenibacillus yanchengensis TaxID=2035833 RepID=A0ABW4YR02_9BACL